jgi:hypothetical protein
MNSKINSLLSITLVFLVASTFHLDGVDARKKSLRGEGYRRAVQNLEYTTVPLTTLQEEQQPNCPVRAPKTDDRCTGSEKRAKSWSSCTYTIISEQSAYANKRHQCNCGADLLYDCRPRGPAPIAPLN